MKLGLLAGKGDLPYQVINAHPPSVVIGFYDQTPEELLVYAKKRGIPFEWAYLGQVKTTLNLLNNYQVTDVLLAGSIAKPSFSSLSLDWLALKWLMKIQLASFGDDALLTTVIKLIEAEGFRVIPTYSVVPELMCPDGTLTKLNPNAQAHKDIQLGFEIINTISPLDIGQSVIIQEGMVLGVEAIEGTDELIRRCNNYKREGSPPILIKGNKAGQTDLADLPTIGPQTIELLNQSRFQGLAVKANKTQIINREEVLKMCDSYNIFLVGVH